MYRESHEFHECYQNASFDSQAALRPTIGDELELHRVDCLASHGNLDNYYFVKSRLESFEKEQIKPARL